MTRFEYRFTSEDSNLGEFSRYLSGIVVVVIMTSTEPVNLIFRGVWVSV